MASSEKEGKSQIGTLEVLGLTAFGCVFAWYYCTLLWLIPQFGNPNETLLAQIALLFGIAFGTLLVPRSNLNPWFDKILRKPLAIIVAGLIECSFPLLMLAFKTQTDLFFAISIFLLAISGFVSVFSFAYWENYSTSIRLSSNLRFVPVAMCIAGALFVACRFAFANEGEFIAIALLLVSCSIALFVRNKTFDEDKKSNAVASRNDWKSGKHVKVSVLFAIIGIGLGYSWAILISMSEDLWVYAIGIGVLVVFVTLILLENTKFSLSVAMLERLCVGGLALFLIANSIYPNTVISIICTALIVILWFFFRAFNGGLLLRYAVINNFPAPQYLALGKIGTNFGMVVGWIIGWVLITEGWSFTIATSTLALIILIAGFTLLPFESIPESLSPVEAVTSSGKTIIVPLAEVNSIAEEFELSPREGEVLAYLARGRNMRHIAEKLFISENTAKAHIAHIYRKLGVHSQQELINVFEAHSHIQ